MDSKNQTRAMYSLLISLQEPFCSGLCLRSKAIDEDRGIPKSLVFPHPPGLTVPSRSSWFSQNVHKTLWSFQRVSRPQDKGKESQKGNIKASPIYPPQSTSRTLLFWKFMRHRLREKIIGSSQGKSHHLTNPSNLREME